MSKKGKETEFHLNQFVTRIKESKKEELLEEAFSNIQRIRKVDVDGAFRNVSSRIQKTKSKTRFLVVMQRVAAVLFLPLLALSIYLYTASQTGLDQGISRTISNPSGIRSQLELPDGSRIWLNAGSSISYMEPFATRNISIEGEAFFDVTHDEKNPFVVDAGKLKVKVLGTRFNVMAYAEEQNIEVVLEKGSVSITTDAGNAKGDFMMKPNSRVIYNKETAHSTIQTENIEKYIAWHKGRLVFDNTPLPELARILERWYHVDVRIQSNEIDHYRFTTTFENVSITNVAELLELSSPIRIDYQPAQLNEDGTIAQKAQLIIDKE
ncbi:MAG: FecR domain-containing protein [Bacteroidota bacterium]